MASVEIGEVVKEFILNISPLKYAVKGRIAKFPSTGDTQRYEWAISHHYRPTIPAGVYYPSKTRFSSLDDAEAAFKGYAASFVPEIEVVANEFY